MTRFIFPASFLVLLLAFASQAQHLREPIRIDGVQPGKAVCSDVQHLPPAGERFHDAADNWNFYLRSMEKRKVGFEYVQELKNTYGDKRMMEVPSLKTEETNVITPVIGQQFDTNNFDGSYPPDNTIAVSNNGWIVSVTNSSVRYYDAAGAFKGSKSFETFADDDALTSILYDPKILYDSGSDRFFLTFLHGYTSATSDVLVFFSKTGNPMDGWNYYKFHVSDAVANRWADFPNVGVSNNEVYVTVNLFTNSNYFDKVLLYQINKQNGYNNQSLQFTTWTDITDNQGDPPFTLVPVSYGHQGNYGPGIVLCATEDPGSSNKVQIFDLTADLGGGAQLNGYSASIPSFQIGGNAVQPDDGDEMDIGDCRMKNAFFLNNTVHCVFTSNYQSGWNGINYSRVELSSMTATNKKFGAVGRDMGYPALASFSNNAGDKTVVIGYEESSTTINPCFKAVVCDDAMTFGTAVLLKAGATFIDVDPGNFERWGDYLGIHRRFTTSSPTVWVFGIYAKNSSNGGIYGNNAVELINTSETALGSSTKPSADITVYPNPGELYFTVMLQVAKAAETRFELYDASGRLVKHLTTKHLTPGKFQFGFNSDALSAGVYFLRVQTAEKTIANEKIVIQ